MNPTLVMDLGSVGNRKRPMRNASTFLLIPGPDGQYFTTANLWTRDQGQASSLTNDFDYVSVG